MLRDMVAGMMRILSSRSSIKNEFRMSVTTIQPVENNPLKFSATVDDALENMFLKKGNAYKGPKQSVEEGFTGIAEHQIAVLSGMRSAFKGVLERFDPLVLEKRFDKQNKGGLIPGSKNAKNWELFTEYYTDLAGDLDNSFQYLFGDDFVRAYEDQLQRLAITRSKQKN
jgi:type VI secretion system protein